VIQRRPSCREIRRQRAGAAGTDDGAFSPPAVVVAPTAVVAAPTAATALIAVEDLPEDLATEHPEKAAG
jgi:hypothetical protein